MYHLLKIQSIEPVTHDVLRFRLDRPAGIDFKSGQAADITINKEGWKDEMRPFTFTSLPEDDWLEFTIKTYPSHNGVTNQLRSLKKGDELIIHGVFGDIGYKGEGSFIAGGAGVTPFISIFRNLKRNSSVGNSKLIFANKTRADIINEDEFNKLLGKNFINILSDEKIDGFAHGFISAAFLREHLLPGKHIYLCGPPPMMDAVEKQLKELKIEDDKIVKEAF